MRIVLVIALLFGTVTAWSQNVRINESEKTKATVDTYNEKAANHSNRDSSFFYYYRAVQIARSILYYEGELEACRGLVQYHKNDKVFDDRLEYAYRIVQIQEKRGSNKEKAAAYQQLGLLYFDEKIYEKAIENFEQGFLLNGISIQNKYEAGIWLTRSFQYANQSDSALIIARKLQFEEEWLTDFQRITLYKEKAEVYHSLSAYNEELDAYKNIVRIAKGTKHSRFVPIAWNNVGFVYKFLGNTNEAKNAFLNTLQTAKPDHAELKAAANYNLGLILHNQGRSDSAMVCFQAAHDLYTNLSDWKSLASCRNMMSLSYFHSQDPFNAQNMLNTAFEIERKYKLKAEEAKSHEIQSLYYEDQFDYESSLKSYKRYLSIRDSLLTLERAEEDRLKSNQYRAEQIEKQLRVVWAQNEIEIISLAEERARMAAEQERTERQLKEQELAISQQEAKVRLLQLQEEELKVQAKQRELELIQRDNELKELELEKERLLASDKEKEIELLEIEAKRQASLREAEEQRREAERQRYQNRLQLIFGVLLFFILILLVILIAYRQLRKRKKRIEEQNAIIAESKKEIEIQKEKSDSLLLNILPHSVAEELKANGAAKPRLYDEISVGFTDFSGFTMISEKLSPEDLVAQLDAMFLEFDKIIERHGLQRIKTIGDAYMFAAGLPDPLEDHAARSIKAAIEMRDFINEFNAGLKPENPTWNIRIGVHSGPVVAGVIGIKKFAYDIWGDTVNTAARMESSGAIGKVNISGETKAQLNGEFTTEHRGKVEAKNKGAIEMYFVEKK
ncbi:MAG: hypothetical protein NXI10_11560 [bacterium]|nr:hypothetical protein [bacterium]